MYDVVALGELLIDFASLETDAAGYPTMKANPGGAPGNFLAALNAYGAKTAFLGKVGDDAFGHSLVGTMHAAGIETGGICIDPDVFTTLAFVTFDAQGDRSFSFARKPGADTQLKWEDVKLELIDKAKVFHFGTLSLTDEPVRTTTRKCIAYAKEQGKLITYDPNLRLPLWMQLRNRSSGACIRQMWSRSAMKKWNSCGAAPPRKAHGNCWKNTVYLWQWLPWVPRAAICAMQLPASR